MTNNWKQKYEETYLLLKEKENTLKEYQKAIQENNHILQEVMEKLSLELKMANQIHRLLLPVDLPIIPGCEFSFKFQPAQEEGKSKDFYEILPHYKKKSFSLIMSSCVSHSLSALMFSARIKVLGQTQKVNELTPHEFISLLISEAYLDNSFLPKDLEKEYFFKDKLSLFYAFICQRTYEISYCLIGDIKAFFQSADHLTSLKESKCEWTSKGITNLSSQTISLHPKDRIIITSPGVLSTLSPEGISYPISSLKEQLLKSYSSSIHEARNHLFYELNSFSQGRPSNKDQSTLIMDIKSHILKLQKN